MFALSESPLSMPPALLDEYLARGWFRMNQTIFTTHFLQFNNIFYNAVWLRIDVANYQPAGSHLAALKGLKGFKVEIKRAEISGQHEALYEKYKKAVSFESYSSLYQLLMGSHTYNIYNTWQVNIYDGAELIAAGFFDTGKTSAQGIVSIYDPAYKKYSLGKCLIYTKIDYCRRHKLQYFYPGYAVPGYAAFDYKLQIATQNLQYYNRATGTWAPYHGLQAMYKPLDEMYQMLAQLRDKLCEKNYTAQLYYYRFFDARLSISLWENLLDYPVFLLLNQSHTTAVTRLAVFDIATRQYGLFDCVPVYSIENGDTSSTVFSSEVMSIYNRLYATTNAGNMADAIIKYSSLPPAFVTN